MSLATFVRHILGMDGAEIVRAEAKRTMREVSHKSRNEAMVATMTAKVAEKAADRASETLEGTLVEQKSTLRQTEVDFLRRIRGEGPQ